MSKVDENVFKFDDFIKELNNDLKNNKLEDAIDRLQFFSNNIIKAYWDKNEWALDPRTAPWGDNQYVLIAHSNRPIRALVRLEKSGTSKNIPGALQYVIYKLTVSTTGKKKGTIKEHKKKPHCLYTSKRGFWFIWKPSLDMKLFAPLTTETNNKLLNLYNTYVDGMETEPADSYCQSSPDKGFEQFILHTYPNQQWKKAVQKELEMTQKNNKRNKPDSGEDDDDEEDDKPIKTKKPKYIPPRAKATFDDAAYALLTLRGLKTSAESDDESCKSDHVKVSNNMMAVDTDSENTDDLTAMAEAFFGELKELKELEELEEMGPTIEPAGEIEMDFEQTNFEV